MDQFFTQEEVIQAELKNTGVVSGVALSQSPATGVWSKNTGFTWQGNESGTDDFASLGISPEYAGAVGLEFLAGRNFSREFASDTSGFVINETAARLMGYRGAGLREVWGKPWPGKANG